MTIKTTNAIADAIAAINAVGDALKSEQAARAAAEHEADGYARALAERKPHPAEGDKALREQVAELTDRAERECHRAELNGQRAAAAEEKERAESRRADMAEAEVESLREQVAELTKERDAYRATVEQDVRLISTLNRELETLRAGGAQPGPMPVKIDEDARYTLRLNTAPTKTGRAYKLAIVNGPTVFAPISQTTITDDARVVTVPGWLVESKGLALFAQPIIVDAPIVRDEADDAPEAPATVVPAPTRTRIAPVVDDKPLATDPTLQDREDDDLGFDGPDELTLG